jgi:hypothetical protein
VTEFEKLVLFMSPLISLLGLVMGWMRWKGGEKNVADSSAANNFADAASKTAGMNERLQTQIDAHLENERKLSLQIAEAGALIATLKEEREAWLREREAWQDRNVELAKRVGVLAKNYEGVERELERIRKWGYANCAEVSRLGGTPIRLEDVQG